MNADVLILWAWEHDAAWVNLLSRALAARGVSCQLLHYDAWGDLPGRLRRGELRARLAIDRVWDWGGDYSRHVDAVRECIPVVLNDYERVARVWRKPTVHYELIRHGLRAPHMLVLPACAREPDIAAPDLAPLGPRFSVKGAYSGGSGVLKAVETWSEVQSLRQQWPHDETVLQTWVEPRLLDGRRAWFRVFHACGASFPCWSDDQTHDQTAVTPRDEAHWRLGILRGISQQIAGLCGLNAFSTEMALDDGHRWQVVDYVNEPCDYRMKSAVPNGVPDEVAQAIAERIAGWCRRILRASHAGG